MQKRGASFDLVASFRVISLQIGKMEHRRHFFWNVLVVISVVVYIKVVKLSVDLIFLVKQATHKAPLPRTHTNALTHTHTQCIYTEF